MNSGKFELTLTDLKEWGRTAIIIYSPTLLLALNQLENGSFDLSLLYASILSITIDLIRRFLTDYKAKYGE